ncbi:sensor histidine kinase [Mucilaginibacter myungsuensis]|uniref:histidine kinase n=1 Tax=Mucilaginibacter myungsuensis TaxID=649104 RepID=A0A929L2I3_9SPHI|nr:HAMP domain-containing sensor histidine kinase [Mucilaginibacter myungsuensis]MBE9662895.1 HAMP domain-containing histidine kinase [Mucilaginibacter myungsuensis]MDN3598515.1 HAMP domain-containing sensor histidine kinase [Mucilaginibacter myungsuensis]
MGPLHASNYFLKLKKIVAGHPEKFPLTDRIFHSLLAISMAALIYNIPLNIFVGLPLIAVASAVSCGLVAFIYYLSRYRHKTAVARLLYCITGTTLFFINYFLNSGIDGPTGYFFILIMVANVAIAPVKEYWFWVGGNILIVAGLHAIQYYNPSSVPYTYPAKIDRYVDNASAYATVVLVILACFYAIRKHYDAERLEAQQNAAKLSQLDAEKNKLFSIIGHDLRSPLAHIQGYLELLAEHDLTDEERRDIKAQLLASTRGTLDMLNNVLNWSKNQMSGVTFLKEQLDVKQLLEQQMQLATNIAMRKHIDLITEIEPHAGIWGNADMVQLIVRNLVNNAIKFTLPNGWIKLNVTTKKSKTLIAISDSGTGSPEQFGEQVFQLSGRSSVGTANEKGVGLGLVLCREYTLALDGKIWFEHDALSGTTFYVELPATV